MEDSTIDVVQTVPLEGDILLPKLSIQDRQSIRLSDVPASKTRKWIIENFIVASQFNLLTGLPGTGKGFLTAKIVASVTTGTMLFNRYKSLKGNVLYICLEDDREDIKRILEDAGADTNKVFYLRTHADMKATLEIQSKKPFSLPDSFQELVREIEAVKPVLVIFDTLRRIVGNNTIRENNKIATQLLALCENTGIGILMLHHPEIGVYNVKNLVTRMGRAYMPFHETSRISYIMVSDDSSNVKVLGTIKNNTGVNIPVKGFKIIEDVLGRVYMFELSNSSMFDQARPATIESNILRKKILQAIRVYGPENSIFIANVIKEPFDAVNDMIRSMLKEGTLYETTQFGVYGIQTSTNSSIQPIHEDATKQIQGAKEKTESIAEHKESRDDTSIAETLQRIKDTELAIAEERASDH